jgi:hypothetical protein
MVIVMEQHFGQPLLMALALSTRLVDPQDLHQT